jgi:hypothetical protein
MINLSPIQCFDARDEDNDDWTFYYAEVVIPDNVAKEEKEVHDLLDSF